MKHFYLTTIILLLVIQGKSQSYNIELTTGANIGLNIEGDIGYSFTDKDLIFGGVKLQSYKLRNNNNNPWDQNYVFNGALSAGARYMLCVRKLKNVKPKNQGKEIGIYPEAKLYFNPYLPRSFTFTDTLGYERTVWGKYNYQFAYGIGFGIFIHNPEESHGFLALKFELSSLDAFKTLRQFNNNYLFPDHHILLFGLSLFIW